MRVHTYVFDLGADRDYSNPSVRADISFLADLCVRDEFGGGTLPARIEMRVVDKNNAYAQIVSTYSGGGSYQTFGGTLNQFVSSGIDWTHVRYLHINVCYEREASIYCTFFDHVRFTGTPEIPGAAGQTNGIYLSNNDSPPGPPVSDLVVLGSNGVEIAGGDSPQTAKGTKFFPSALGVSVTNTFSILNNGTADLHMMSHTNLGVGMPTNLSVAVHALARGPNGELYAGGFFTNAGGVSARQIARSANRMAKWVHTYVMASGVQPPSGSWTGGYPVVVTGINLGNGSDITNVTLCGANVSGIVSQSATQVVVAAGGADVSHVGLGDVRVYSTSFGETVEADAFSYEALLYTLTIESAYGACRPVGSPTERSLRSLRRRIRTIASRTGREAWSRQPIR
ncbi:MAG TPA: hypothetical protein DCZ95_15835 [Verrucomicrobia bacterium]|nr:MAG: hypothetical protein A2X46_12785 [Lentisphaerae bacterium GWF2_57_35]HBA85555.1 hypothetical protein [Verrucomicrobiota bacterium]